VSILRCFRPLAYVVRLSRVAWRVGCAREFEFIACVCSRVRRADSEVKGAKTLMSPVAVAKCAYDDEEWMVPAQLGPVLPCFSSCGSTLWRKHALERSLVFLSRLRFCLPEVSGMSIPKTDLATWVKLGMKRRVGEGFVATGTQVRAEAKCGHDSRCRGRGVSATQPSALTGTSRVAVVPSRACAIERSEAEERCPCAQRGVPS
jgi:hypothetical protein